MDEEKEGDTRKCTLDNMVKVFLIITCVTVVIVLTLALLSFTISVFRFSIGYGAVLDNIRDSAVNTESTLDLRLRHLERIGELHGQATNRDLLVFLYAFLSSVLIGVSAYFIKTGHEKQEAILKENKQLAIESKKLKSQIKYMKEEFKEVEGELKSVIENGKIVTTDLSNAKNRFKFNSLTELLSDALVMVAIYHNQEDADSYFIGKFKDTLGEAALLCRSINFDLVDDSNIERMIKRINYLKYLCKSPFTDDTNLDDYGDNKINTYFKEISDILPSIKSIKLKKQSKHNLSDK